MRFDSNFSLVHIARVGVKSVQLTGQCGVIDIGRTRIANSVHKGEMNALSRIVNLLDDELLVDCLEAWGLM